MTSGETTILKEIRDIRREVGDLREDVAAIKATMAAEDKAAESSSQYSGNRAAWVAAAFAGAAIVLHFLPSPEKSRPYPVSVNKSNKYTGTIANTYIDLERFPALD